MTHELTGRLEIEGRGAVLVARADGGPHALSGRDIAGQLEKLVDRAERHPDIRAVVLTAHCARLLSGYKRPSSLIVVDSIARNALGKIDKVSLRAAHAAPAGARVGQREDRDEKSWKRS